MNPPFFDATWVNDPLLQNSQGIAAKGKYLYVATKRKNIVQIDMGSGFVTTLLDGNKLFPYYFITFYGLAMVDNFLYVVHNAGILQYNLVTGNYIIFWYRENFLNPYGIASDGRYLYVAILNSTEYTNGFISRIDIQTVTGVPWFTDVNFLNNPQGLVVVGDELYVGMYGPESNVIIRISLFTGKADPTFVYLPNSGKSIGVTGSLLYFASTNNGSPNTNIIELYNWKTQHSKSYIQLDNNPNTLLNFICLNGNYLYGTSSENNIARMSLLPPL